MSSTSIYSDLNPVSQSKICNECNITKPISQFSKAGNGYRGNCKSCRKEHKREYDKKRYQDNTEQHSINAKEYYQANKEYIKKCAREYTHPNPEHYKEYRIEYEKEYRQANKGAKAAREAKRRATKLKATPKWIEVALIKQLYIDCQLISEMTGILHHIDHIVPLVSDIVSGLHCFTNLRIISASENLSKSNSYWPDMP